MAEFPLQPVREVLHRRAEDAANELRSHGERLDRARRKLAELEQYRSEYLTQRDAARVRGTTASALRDFEVFLARLDEALAAQAGELRRLEAIWEASRENWMEHARREHAFDVLAERHEARENQAAIRQEQKFQDEFASRRARATRRPDR
ncbi:MAG: flagellar export protein FliJ [Betaproteobacteria bacterium]|nr:flagellar export protein FliJ [Betaproteobacteria bacterium]